MNGKHLAHVLQFLEPRESSLVCKYWCQLTAYITEKEDNPELTDDDFEILFDYEAGVDDGSTAVATGAHSRRGHMNDPAARDKSASVGEALSQSQSDAPGSQSPAPEAIQHRNGGTSSYSEGDAREEDLEESASQGSQVRSSVDSPSLAAVLDSVSQQGAKVNSSSATSLKKMSIADYPDDIKTYLRASLSAMSRMEGEKAEIKARIDQWKLNFERRHRRQPSDQEKLTNISSLFQKFSKLKRAIKAEEEKIFKIANAIDKLQG